MDSTSTTPSENDSDLLNSLLSMLLGTAITALSGSQRAEIQLLLTQILNNPKARENIIKLARSIIEVIGKYGPVTVFKLYEVARWITLFGMAKMTKVFHKKPKNATPQDPRFAVQIDDADFYNVAVVGYTSNGKTTFINAIRGLKNWEIEKGAAETSPLENTATITYYESERYPRLRLYDIPGNTTTEPTEGYFKKMKLDSFVCILVFVGELSLHDLKVVELAQKYGKAKNIIFVRSKMDEFMRQKWRNDQGLPYPPKDSNEETFNHFQEKAAKEVEALTNLYQEKQASHPTIKDVPHYWISSYSMLNALLQEPTDPRDLTEFLIYQENQLVEKIVELSCEHAGVDQSEVSAKDGN